MAVCLPFPAILCKRRPFQNMRRESRTIPGSGSRLQLVVVGGAITTELQIQSEHTMPMSAGNPIYNSLKRTRTSIVSVFRGTQTIHYYISSSPHPETTQEKKRARSVVESSFKYLMRDRSQASITHPSIPFPPVTLNPSVN